MSAGDTLDDKRKRRRELRRQAAEASPVESIEADDDQIEDEEEDGDDSSGRGISERKGRATPSRRALQEIEEAKAEGNFITRRINGLLEYIAGVRSEVQKVAWPTREETRRLTGIVLVVMILSSITLGVISLLFSAFINAGLQPGSSAIFFVALIITVVIFAIYVRRSNRRTTSF
ncbi:MAG: preprotein translocase subunit SecE [Anaerolineae bacterium]|nr:preprotein translocase subunit SecE [Anaerolineae bacterium]